MRRWFPNKFKENRFFRCMQKHTVDYVAQSTSLWKQGSRDAAGVWIRLLPTMWMMCSTGLMRMRNSTVCARGWPRTHFVFKKDYQLVMRYVTLQHQSSGYLPRSWWLNGWTRFPWRDIPPRRTTLWWAMRLGMEPRICGFGEWCRTHQPRVATQTSSTMRRRRSIRSTTWSFYRSQPLWRLTQLEREHIPTSTETGHVKWYGYSDMAEVLSTRPDGMDHRRRCRASSPTAVCIFKQLFWMPTTLKNINNAILRGWLTRLQRTPVKMMKKMFPGLNVRLWSVNYPGEQFQRQMFLPLWRPFRVNGMNGANGALAKQFQGPRYPRSWYFHHEFATDGSQLPTPGVTKRRQELLSKVFEIHTYLCWLEMLQFYLEMGWWLFCSGARAMGQSSTMLMPSQPFFKDYLMMNDRRRSTWDRPRTRSHYLVFQIGIWTSSTSWLRQSTVQPTHLDAGMDALEEWWNLWSGRFTVWILVFSYGWQLGRMKTVKKLHRWWRYLVSTWTTSWSRLYRTGRRMLWNLFAQLSSGVDLGKRTTLSSRGAKDHQAPRWWLYAASAALRQGGFCNKRSKGDSAFKGKPLFDVGVQIRYWIPTVVGRNYTSRHCGWCFASAEELGGLDERWS